MTRQEVQQQWIHPVWAPVNDITLNLYMAGPAEGRPVWLLHGCSSGGMAGSDDYQVSTKGRFLPARGAGLGAAFNPRSSQERVSCGSITASISRKLAMLMALPFW